MLDFLRELSVSSEDAKTIVNSGIGLTGLKITDLFEDVVGVCDVVKGTCKVAISFTGIFKNLSW